MATHDVTNQPPPLVDYSLLDANPPLLEALKRAAPHVEAATRAFGQRVSSEEVQTWAAEANRYAPVLRTHDRYGARSDTVDFHPAWHALLATSVGRGIHAPWANPSPTAQLERAADYLMMAEIEAGHGCPVTMTFASIPALSKEPAVLDAWREKILSREYDRRFLPVAQKTGALVGMGMTEKQGGSDVRANTTRAVRDGDAYRLTGHKWFCSAPMCDAFLMLAQADKGLTCFLVPRFLPDGTKNSIFLQRLKDKLGNRSNASSEIELENTWAQRVGDEGRGVPTIIEMASHTRFDCVLGSSGLMHQALSQAAHHVAHRAAFGHVLAQQPLMRSVVADLAVESEAATLLALRLANAYDDPSQVAFRRIATAVGKYWVCKRAITQVFEAMECLGGAGYVEESVMPRLFREAPVNSIWEGSGNVMCLDVLRALNKEPESADALRAELATARGADARYDAFVAKLSDALVRPDEAAARHLVGHIAVALQAAQLLRVGHKDAAAIFCATRLGEMPGTFGALPAGVATEVTEALVARATPPGF